MLSKLALVTALFVLGVIFAGSHCGEDYPDCGHEEGAACPTDGSGCVYVPPPYGQTCSSGGGGGGGGGVPTATPTPANMPPDYSISRYMSSVNSTVNFDSGCYSAMWNQTHPMDDALVIISYRAPRFVDGEYGTRIYDDTFADATEIENAAKNFAWGYNNCYDWFGDPDHYIRIGIGTTNHWNSPDQAVTFEHGWIWGNLVDNVWTWVDGNGWTSRVGIYGAIDAETGTPPIPPDMTPDWASPSATSEWIDGYASGTIVYFYNFGDAGGCETSASYDGSYNDLSCNNEWSIDDIYHISWGNPWALSLPEIYRQDGVNASQWRNVKLRAQVGWADNMVISGSLTQYWACIQRPPATPCPQQGLFNHPSAGWIQLGNAINSPPLTPQPLKFSSSTAWEDVCC
jgi:hypothetical protein